MAIHALHHNDNYSISLLCQCAGIARSAYYKWTQRTPTTRQQENDLILKEISELYEQGHTNYGYRKMTRYLNEKYNTQYNHKRIYRLMKLASLQSGGSSVIIKSPTNNLNEE
ncbi:IS3 family transposase [Lysinibacillus sp. NPDC097195]|uniref:IS3 family transposase n=1 Tax=Lysinibacillus sp. NPDC097195 TaxID=3364141 RepID=UPI0037FF161A